MSRCVSLYQALPKATVNSSGWSAKRLEIFSYIGSKRIERSVVNMVGACFFVESNASGTITFESTATHWFAPAGLFVSFHSVAKRLLKNPWLHFVGVVVQVTSKPDVMASVPLPDL